MITPFIGICPTCQHDHGGDFDDDEPSLDQYRALYFAQCQLTDEQSEKLKEKSDATLTGKIKELESIIQKQNQTITNLNNSLVKHRVPFSHDITYGQ